MSHNCHAYSIDFRRILEKVCYHNLKHVFRAITMHTPQDTVLSNRSFDYFLLFHLWTPASVCVCVCVCVCVWVCVCVCVCVCDAHINSVILSPLCCPTVYSSLSPVCHRYLSTSLMRWRSPPLFSHRPSPVSTLVYYDHGYNIFQRCCVNTLITE